MSSNSKPSKLKRQLFIGGGWLCVILALIGVMLPLLPTVPFLLLALYFFGASSPKFQKWLLQHPKLGPIATRLKKKEGLTKKEKIHSLVIIWLSMGGVLIFVAAGTHWQYAIGSLLIFETWFILRFKTYDKEKTTEKEKLEENKQT